MRNSQFGFFEPLISLFYNLNLFFHRTHFLYMVNALHVVGSAKFFPGNNV